MYIAVRIHNNSLGRVIECENEEEAKNIVKSWAIDQFHRPLTNEEMNSLENELEIYNEDDADNIFCFSVGITEFTE